MITSDTFTPRTIGETENALRALLTRELAGTSLDYPAWVALRLIVEPPVSISSSIAAERLRQGLKIDPAAADAVLERLIESGLVAASGDVLIGTPAGVALHTDVGARVRSLTRTLWAGLAAEDLATAQHVLSTITQRANALFGA